MMRAICRVIGHRWVFRTITLPKQLVCARCGTRPK